MAYDYDLIVIGAGPGGYVAAIRASQLGLNVAVVEKDKVGGVCLNIGCIPSKALIHQADVFRGLTEAEELGVAVDRSGFDYANVFRKSREAAEALGKGVQHLLKKNKVDLIAGTARLTGPHDIALEGGKALSAANILIATGSRPRELPGLAFDETRILSSTGALMQETLPGKALIVGSGAIGMEFAYVWNAFGVDVHVVELLDQVLPLEDAETATVVRKELERRGVAFSTGSKAAGVTDTNAGLEVTIESNSGEQRLVTVDRALVAVGRMPNTEGLGLSDVGVETDRGFIRTGDFYETTVAGVYAIGDVIGAPLLAHVASREGEIAVEHIAGHAVESRIDLLAVPGATYCEPQIGSFGYNERTAKEAGVNYKTATFPYRGAGKSVAVGRSEGLVKVLVDPETGELLGGHVVGADATEMIHELLLAKTAELLPEDITTMIHAHPTLSETVLEVMRGTFGKPIHF